MEDKTKRILVIHYSQSGQLTEILSSFCSGFDKEGLAFDHVKIEPLTAHPFPWTGYAFFDAMPETVLGIPQPVKDPLLRFQSYDLIILGWQPWFLSPSLPVTSLFHHPVFSSVFKDTPVVIVCGARNMWTAGFAKLKDLIRQAGGVLSGHIVLTDKAPNLISAVTIQYWMFTGKRDRLWGVFPKPGVSERDVAQASVFGSSVCRHLKANDLVSLQPELIEKGAVPVNDLLMFVESRGSMIFSLWAKKIIKKTNRRLWIMLFKYYLIFALFLISPIVILVYVLLIRPLTGKRIKRKVREYQLLLSE